MSDINMRDVIGLAAEKLGDIEYLAQEIREEYFEPYDCEKPTDMSAILHEHTRYTSLYRILSDCVSDVTQLLRETQKQLT